MLCIMPFIGPSKCVARNGAIKKKVTRPTSTVVDKWVTTDDIAHESIKIVRATPSKVEAREVEKQ